MMADETMLSLFDTDPSFLDELTGSGTGSLSSAPQSLAGVIPDDGGLLSQSLGGMQSTLSQADPLLNTMQPQSYSQISGLSGTCQPSASPPFSDFGQFTPSDLQHISDPSLGRTQNIVTQSQFGNSPGGNSLLQQPAGTYTAYNVSSSQRITTPPQQQLGLVQSPVWNQSPAAGNASFIQQPSQQQAAQQNTGKLHSDVSAYLTHHDYALPPAQQPVPRLSHFPETTKPNQTSYLQGGLGSPPPTSRIVSISSPNSIGHMQSRPVTSQPFASGAQTTPAQSGINLNNFGTQHQMQSFHSDFIKQGPQLNSGTSQVGNLQHFTYTVQQNQTTGSQAIGDAPPLTHYSSSSPHGSPFRTPYSGVPPRGSALSPRPTPTPPSPMSSDCFSHVSSPQGGLTQSNLQQLEQLVAPSLNTVTSKPYNQVMQTSSISLHSGAQNIPVSSTAVFVNSFQGNSSDSQLVADKLNSSMGVTINTSLQTSAVGQSSPSCVVIPCVSSQQSSEIQQQIGQYCSVAQPEQLHLIKAQHPQPHILQIQRQPKNPQPAAQVQTNIQQLLPHSVVAVTSQASQFQQPQTSASSSPQKIHTITMQPSQCSEMIQHVPSSQQNQLPPQVPVAAVTKPALQTTIVITHGALQKDLPQLPDLREPEKPAEERILSPPKRKREVAKLRRAQQQQEKANKIISEAIAKAQAEGKTELPRVVTPSIPLTVTELTKEEETKPKKRERKPKGEKKPKTPKTPKPKPSSRKKPVATFLKNKKKRLGHSSDASDIEVTPLPSPENEDDNVKKRRSARNTKRKKYLDDIDINLSDENQEVDIESIDGVMAPKPVQFFVENPSEEDAVIVEKILGMRIRKNELEDVEEFFVKYKNFSYLHCEWKTVQELEKDKRIHMKLKRYRIKRLQMNNYFEVPDEEELFNPDYVEVDRVLDVSETPDPVSGEVVIHYLVKWRGLPYDESTWELLQDVDPAKVRLFKKIREIPPEADLEHKLRPSAADWKKLSESRNYKNANQLRDYQLEGVNWLKFSWYNRQNCILADEMGLGKTIQSLAFLKEMSLCGIKGPFLVVAPLSTIANWQREFETWTDMNVIVYHGTSPSRNMIQEYEMYYKNENGQRLTNIYKFNALITTYEIIISDCEVLSQVEWRCAIIDEAHRLKNKNCRLLQGLTMFDIEHRVLLTGTPLQNNVEELFSLLNFLEPDKFHSSEAFLSEFGDLQTDTQVEKLQQILKPMMLRRIKEDVEKNLAPKEETIVEVELTNIQKKYYRAILEKNFTFLAKGSTSSTNVPNLMNTMMELRKCCNHPYLVTGAEEKILEDARQRDGNDPEKLFNAMVQSSGKLVLLDKLLPKLKQGGHKVLIFSQMIRVLDILEDYLLQKRYLYERLDGRIRGNLRQEAIDRFSKPESDRFIFLLCTRAGGLGINLTAADTVIIYDSDWNPQNDLQAQARCHRIGQSKAVKVYRLITRNSYEREMFDRASRKLGLDKAVLQSMSGEKPVNLQAQLSKKEIEDLLRKGAYGALMEEDNAGDKFCEEDIDQILQRRTRVIQIETEGKGSTFAKASFSMTSNSDIDINDPNFWQKWAKKAELDVNELNSKNDLIIQEPRQRRQTTRYGNNDLVEVSDLDSSSDSDEMGDKIEEFSKRRGRKKGSTRRKFIDDEFEADELIGDGYARSELFKVEKNLLVYGWGRWMDILNHGRFKRTLTEKDVETISRAMLLYSLQHYKGDERIKSFIWDLVTPSNDGTLKNHMGLSAPVPRGRKGKKAKKEAKNFSAAIEMEKANLQMDPEIVLSDSGYKRHIQRHSNKVLLRVRLLYYLKQEVIGDESERINRGVNISDLDIPNPCAEGDPPVFWWDEEADKSLLIGVFKHGYEKYNLMRQDPYLCFLSKCGPPDGAALLREQNDEDDNDNKDDDDDGDLRMNCSQLDRDDEDDDISLSSAPGTPCRQPQCIQSYETTENGKLPFPSPPDLNTRLRRVITGYQRNHKKEQLKIAQKAKRMERRERAEAANKEREIRKRKSQQRWSRREEADFYRIVSTFGVEYDRDVKRYQWDRFRALARLEKKYDDTLTEYFQAFYHMCLQVCAKFNKEDEGKQATSSSVPSFPPNNIFIEPITEERASRCLARIDLLNKIREEIICHPKFEENLKLCQASFDMPSWWICGKHDKDLMVGAARHGVARTDYHILHDPTLSFKEILGNKVNNWTPTPWLCGLSNFGLNRIMKPETPSIKDEDSDVESKDGREKDQVMHDFDKKEEPLSPKMELEESSKDKQLQTDETDSSPKDDIDEMEVDELCKEIEEEIPDRGEEYQSKFSDFEDATQSQGSLTNQIDELGMELDSNEHHTVAEILARSAHGVSVMWPKDKVIFHRLEQICYCVENMEWPGLRRSSYMLAVPDSRSATPVGSSTPKCEVGDSDAGDSLPDALKVKKSCLDKDFQVQMSEGDGLKMRIQKRRRGRRKGEQESDRAFALQHFMNQSAFSSDNESQSEPINLSALQVEHGLMKRKRGRKRKPENLSDVISSIKQNSQLTALTAGPEARVPVISLEDGSRLSGDEAPMRKDLDKWLDEHPGYTADRPDFIEEEQPPPPPPHYCEPVEKRRRRRPRLDPSKLNLESLTGDENVSVINRETGKKITGAKAPPLKYLGEWLEKNPSFDIDPKWGEIVRAKGNLPETLESRILQTSGRRRRHRDNSLPTSMLGDTVFSPASLGAFRFPNTGLMAGFPKLPFGLPFGTLPNLSMANPMLGLTGFNMPAITAAAASLDIKNTNTTENSDKDNGSDTKSTSSAAITTTSATPHPSFPLLYSPLLYNPLLAAQGLTNFTLPTTLATSFASLAQGGGVGVLNGRTEGHDSESDDEEKQYYEEEQVNAEDLSLKNTGYKQEAGDKKKENEQSNDVQQTATDLTVKTKNKPKILNSLKLNRIVDSLKDKVLKIEERQKDKSGQHRKEKNCNQSDTQAEKAEKSKTS